MARLVDLWSTNKYYHQEIAVCWTYCPTVLYPAHWPNVGPTNKFPDENISFIFLAKQLFGLQLLPLISPVGHYVQQIIKYANKNTLAPCARVNKFPQAYWLFHSHVFWPNIGPKFYSYYLEEIY